MNENQRHAVAHARYQVEHATPENPECCFDYELVATLLSLTPASPPEQPAADPVTEITEEMINAAAREMWNDRDARHGGSWDERDPREVCIIQTKATARAALIAAMGQKS